MSNMIRSSRPIDVFTIITRGVCNSYLGRIEREIIEIKGERYLDNWGRDFKVNVLSLELSDSYIVLYLERGDAESFFDEFRSWGLFSNVFIEWYSGNMWRVGFTYSQESFMKLWREWKRVIILDNLV